MTTPPIKTIFCVAMLHGSANAAVGTRPPWASARPVHSRVSIRAVDAGNELVDALGGAARKVLNIAGDSAELAFADVDRASQVLREAHAHVRDGSFEGLERLRWNRRRHGALARLLALDRSAYMAAVAELGAEIPREELPNRQDVPVFGASADVVAASARPSDGTVPDCALPNATYTESPLDVLLLRIFRNFVEEEIDYTSPKPAMAGLAEEGRTYMLRASEEEQEQMVVTVLRRLFTPVGPPFYRTFMSGVYGETQLGPWPWAPALTSWVTPLFFKFLVGPSTPNYRADGQLGGLVVEKCRFLQESGCKGLCLHQCKLPAQRFFAEDLRLPLTVSPNFETQECQWSFGETPRPVAEDPSFPTGCLAGCPSRKAIAEAGVTNQCY